MPTTNIPLTTAPVKVADAADAKFTATWGDSVHVEFATVSGEDPLPEVWHRDPPSGILKRSLACDGDVYARVSAAGIWNTATLVMTK